MNPMRAARAVKARPIAALAALFALATFVNALLVGCGGKSQQSGQPEAQSSSGSSGSPSTGTSETSTAGTATAGDLGSRVYSQRCVLCHGPQGKGDGPGAAGLNPKPRNHTDGSYMNGRTDEQLLEVIRNGKGVMPAWGKVLSDEEIHAVLKHVRSLAVPPYPGPH